ncbi:PepSY-associated TM helix domain-containing protein [Plantactinospora solaniradicis]|uniref:PepSY-associated TM helix domain-containing protein n=1 Tax=Plantactinospora solaniradicis TaxID=1723736 RepID=A0ABW1KJK3_9ACTN
MSNTPSDVSVGAAPAAPPEPARGPVTVPRRSWSPTPLITRLHFYAGILVAPFLAVAALTGLAFVFTPQLDSLVYRDELRVAQVGDRANPVSAQVAAAVAAHPDGTLAAVLPAAAPDATTRVVFTMPELGERQHTVYVDPYTLRIRGTLVTWFGETPLMTWVDDLHRNLHLGAVGRVYSEVAASWLWVLVLGGLTLWLHRQWTARRRARRLLLPDLTARGVRRTRGWHASLGVWLAVGLLFLSATGLTWSRWAGANFSTALSTLRAHSPTMDTTLPDAAPPSPPSGAGHHEGAAGPGAVVDITAIDAVLRHAGAAGITGPIEVTVPAAAGQGWLVAENDRSWPVRLDRIVVDPDAGVVDRSDFADWPLLSQLSKLGVQAHMGYLFGLVNQILLAALAVGLLCVIVWGYRMWWQRRPLRADRRAPVGVPPARGGWRLLRRPLLLAGALSTVAVGVALPVLGVTLLGFLAVDLIVTAMRGRGGGPTPTMPIEGEPSTASPGNGRV